MIIGVGTEGDGRLCLLVGITHAEALGLLGGESMSQEFQDGGVKRLALFCDASDDAIMAGLRDAATEIENPVVRDAVENATELDKQGNPVNT